MAEPKRAWRGAPEFGGIACVGAGRSWPSEATKQRFGMMGCLEAGCARPSLADQPLRGAPEAPLAHNCQEPWTKNGRFLSSTPQKRAQGTRSGIAYMARDWGPT